MPTLAFYISGHGFGHASRQIEIINALASRVTALRIILRTSAPRWLLERTMRPPFSLFAAPSDTGIVQIDSLRLDPQATIEYARDFYEGFDRRVETEARLLSEQRVEFVVSDAPPLACAAADAAGIPSVVVANFTWDWIYEEYREYLAAAPDLIPVIRRAYARAEAAWRLPLHGGFESFRSIVDVPFVARHARHLRNDTRSAFRLPADRRIALASFGGYGVNDLPLRSLDCLATWAIAITGPRTDGAIHHHHDDHNGVLVIEDDEIYARGFRYEDLVHACDVVITKPGYGIISECLANGPAVVYTSRGRFAEYPVMVAQMPRFLRCAYLPNEDLFAGRWLGALDEAVAAPESPERPPTNGAEVIADMIAART
jgi:hypothetical protein